MTLAPVREAADSMRKASTPEPFSSSRTSNWVARGGGLPDYIQHIAHDLVEKRGKSESNAIQMAIGIVKRWARGGGNVDSGTRAAASKAVAEWEALKAKSHAKSAVRASLEPSMGDELALREAALGRVAVLAERFGTAGLIDVLAEGMVAEAATQPSQRDREVVALAEMLRFDLMTLSGVDIPPLARAQEARRHDPFDLIAEAFHADEPRGFGGRWIGHGATRALAARASSARGPVPVAKAVSTALAPGPRGPRPVADERYAGGVRRMSQETRSRLLGAFTPAERGAAKAPQPHSEIGKLYQAAKPHQAAFEKVLDLGKGVAKRLGARVQSTATAEDFDKAKRDVAANPDKPHVIVAAMKGQARAADKVDKKYGGDASRLTDVVRGTVLVPHVDDLHSAIEAIRAELPKGWTLSHPENRYVQGAKGDKVNIGTTSGYRDIAVLLRAPDGFQSELQINTTHMWLAKEVQGGHGTYEVTRAIQEQAHRDGRDMTAAEAQRVKAALQSGRELYDRANLRSSRPRSPQAAGRAASAANAADLLKRGKPAEIDPAHAPALVDALHGDEMSSMHLLQVKGHPNLFRKNAKNLPRDQMPQVPKEHLQGFMEHLRDKGIMGSVEQVAPSSLQATQNQINGAAVARLAKNWDPARQGLMLSSREGHVLDGHHRWGAAALHELTNPGYTIPTLRFSAGTDRILQLMHEYNRSAGVKARTFGEGDRRVAA